jgi:hypothetical protein
MAVCAWLNEEARDTWPEEFGQFAWLKAFPGEGLEQYHALPVRQRLKLLLTSAEHTKRENRTQAERNAAIRNRG